MNMPKEEEGGSQDLGNFKLPRSDPDKDPGDTIFELVAIEIPQTATLEREAFDANLELTNGYTRASTDALRIEVRVDDEEDRDVTNLFHLVPPEVTGIADVEGTDSLGPLATMTSFWQLIPGDGLGGDEPDQGRDYFVSAILTYFVRGKLVQTETESVKITVHPQPKILLHYYIPQNVFIFEPFKLIVEAENIGEGTARNLRIASAQPEIVDNESGLKAAWKVLAVSVGESAEDEMMVFFGDVAPHTTVMQYWVVESDLDGEVDTEAPGPWSVLEKEIQVNAIPVADAGFDRKGVVNHPLLLDGSRSYDPDGHIVTFTWNFDDGFFGAGRTPNHVYSHSGTYQVTLIVKDNNGVEDTDTILVTVEETRPDLKVSEITIVPEDPAEGETLALTAVVQNIGVAPFDPPFYLGFYVDDQYTAAHQVTDPVPPGGQIQVQFQWTTVAGNHRLGVIADDLEDSVAEADEDNNALSIFLRPEQASFADLVATSLAWSEESSQVEWGRETRLTATVENSGDRNAGPFTVAFYVDGDFLVRNRVDGLGHDQVENTALIDVPWIPVAGEHVVTVRADAPIGHVVELDETNNDASLALPDIEVLYPDLTPTSLSFSPADLRVPDGRRLRLTAVISNGGDANLYSSFQVSLFVDGNLVGAQRAGPLDKAKSTTVAFDWPAIAGPHAFTVEVDSGEEVQEKLEDNNQLAAEGEVTILYPDLVPAGVRLSPLSPRYLDEITSSVQVRNAGSAPTQGPFELRLDVGESEMLSLVYGETLPPGGSATLRTAWQAVLPTFEPYPFTVTVDPTDALTEEDEENNVFVSSFTVGEGLVLEPGTTQDSYLEGETPIVFVKVFSSNDPTIPTDSPDGITTTVRVSSGDATISTGEAVFNERTSLWTYVLSGDALEPDLYTADFRVASPLGIYTAARSFRVVSDFTVSVGTDQGVYLPGRAVQVIGSVTTVGGDPVAGVDVLIELTNAIRRTAMVVSAEDGGFTHAFQPAAGEGAEFTVDATATLGSFQRSDSAVFAIRGAGLIPAPATLELAKGTEAEVELRVISIGTFTAELVGLLVENVAEGAGVEVEVESPAESFLVPGGELVFVVRVSAPVGTAGHRFNLPVCVVYKGAPDCLTSSVIRVTLSEAVPVYDFSTPEPVADPLVVDTVVLPGGSFFQAIRIRNRGSAPLTGLAVSQLTLPWLSATPRFPDQVLPGTGEPAQLIISVNPPDDLREGVYHDGVELSSNAGVRTIPIKVHVLNANAGSLQILVEDQDGNPVPDASVVLSYQGPLVFASVRPGDKLEEDEEQATYVATSDQGGVALFNDIPTGGYVVRIEAAFYRTLVSNVDLYPNLDAPQEAGFALVEQPVDYQWDFSEVRPRTPAEAGLGLLADPEANPSLKVAYKLQTLLPAIQLDFPVLQYSMFDGDSADDSILIRNSHATMDLDNLQVRVVTVAPYEVDGVTVQDFPEGALRLGNGEEELFIGTLPAGETLPVHFSIDLSAFPRGEGHFYERRLEFSAGYTDPDTGEGGAASAELPIWVVNPPSEGTVNVEGGISGELQEVLDAALSTVDELALPSEAGDLWVYRAGSQPEEMKEKEPYFFNIKIQNTALEIISNLSFQIIIGTMPMIGNQLPRSVNPTFRIETVQEIGDELSPGGSVDLELKLTPRFHTTRLLPNDDVFFSAAVTYTREGQEYVYFWSEGTAVTVEPAPKLFLSERIEPFRREDEKLFRYIVTVTNVAEGAARGLTVQVRALEGPGIELLSDADYFMGDLESGDRESPLHFPATSWDRGTSPTSTYRYRCPRERPRESTRASLPSTAGTLKTAPRFQPG